MYAVACALPAIDFGPNRGPGLDGGLSGSVPGWFALLMGWAFMGPAGSYEEGLSRVTYFTWLANPMGLIGLIFLARRAPIPAAVAGMVATWLCVWYLIFPFGQPRVGAYLWAASAGLLVASAVAVWLVGKRVKAGNTP